MKDIREKCEEEKMQKGKEMEKGRRREVKSKTGRTTGEDGGSGR